MGKPPVEPNDLATEANDLATLVYLAAQTLGERAEILVKDRPIVVTTIVSIDDLNQSSTFGRLASELVANRLAQRGYLIRDVRYMKGGITLQPETGELVLSREAYKVFASINAQAVVAGTYAVAGSEIYLNLRLIRADNGELLSSADVVVPLDDNTRPLVAGKMVFVPLDQYTGSRVGEYGNAIPIPSPIPSSVAPRSRPTVSDVSSHMLVP